MCQFGISQTVLKEEHPLLAASISNALKDLQTPSVPSPDGYSESH